MKRWIALLLCLLLAGAAVVSAGAEGSTVFEIVAEKTEAQPGEELTFTVTVQSTDACKSYGLLLEFDSAVFEVVGGECTVEGALLKTFDPDKGFAVLLEEEAVPGELLGTFTLRVKEGTASGETVISGVASAKNGDETIPSEVVPVSVTVSGGGAAEDTKDTDREDPTQPTDTQENEQDPTAPTDVRQDGEDTEVPGDTEYVEHVSATAPVLGEEDEQPEDKQGIFLWILIAALVLIAAGGVWLILLARIRKKKGKYMRNG